MSSKLDYKKTFIVGLAFLSICSFWQMYDNVIPLILKNTFHVKDGVAGMIMAADNVLALFLLPAIGALSDRIRTRIGKRMPFVLAGTFLAAFFMNTLPFFDNSYYIKRSPAVFTLFIVALGMLLASMGLYRSPAVALMPDITPKPLRSQANAVINLMGALGGISYLIIASFLYSKSRTKDLEHINYQPLFVIVSAIMICSVIILFIFVKEPKPADKDENSASRSDPDVSRVSKSEQSIKTGLSAPVKKSLILILISIFLWFMGYNAVTTAFTKFAYVMWNMPLGSASACLASATGGAVIAYLPIGWISAKIGRKKSILLGISSLSLSLLTASVYTILYDAFSPLLYALMAVIGISWAAISVNSLPMIVEMCRGSDTGKFTGYYYTFSMAAQIITPVLSGYMLQLAGYRSLFPYSAFFISVSIITMRFVKHGDNKPQKNERSQKTRKIKV